MEEERSWKRSSGSGTNPGETFKKGVLVGISHLVMVCFKIYTFDRFHQAEKVVLS